MGRKRKEKKKMVLPHVVRRVGTEKRKKRGNTSLPKLPPQRVSGPERE